MKEVKIKVCGIWGCITTAVIAIMVCGTVVLVSMQYSQTQKDIANIQAQAMKESASKMSDGLDNIGRGICVTSNRFCSGY